MRANGGRDRVRRGVRLPRTRLALISYTVVNEPNRFDTESRIERVFRTESFNELLYDYYITGFELAGEMPVFRGLAVQITDFLQKSGI